MIEVFLTVIMLTGVLHAECSPEMTNLPATYSKEHLWCYECNTDLRQDRKGDCNDPYMPSSLDLIACPQNESHHCHKSIIFYRNILVTVRACVSSHEINEYCNYEDSFPYSSIECYFCKENACNNKESFNPTSEWYLFVIILAWILI